MFRDVVTRVQRFDVGRLDKFEPTPSGGLRIPGFVSRIGVQRYTTADGTAVRELRLPEEVFAEASVRSFEDAPVTDLHPEVLVDSKTWRQYAVGTVRAPRVDGERVAAEFLVFDAEMIRKIEAGERIEASAGYTCELEETPGTWNGEEYDVIQRGIRANHVALGPVGWGRAGADVALRLDGAGHQLPPGKVMRLDGASGGSVTTKRIVKIDGLDLEAGSDAHLQAVERLIQKMDGELAQARKDAGEARGRADALEAAKAKVDGELADAKKRLDAATSEEEIEKRAESRLALVDRARRVLGNDFSGSGKKDGEIMRAVLDKAGVKVADEADDSYLRGAFDAATRDTGEGDDDADAAADDDAKTDRKDRKDGGQRSGVRVAHGDGASPKLEGLEKVRADNKAFLADAPNRWAASAKR